MLFRQTLTYVPGAAAPPIFAFLTLIVFSRILTPEQYGRFALVIVTVELFKGGFFLWINLSLLRFFASTGANQPLPDLLRSGHIAFLLSAILASLAYLGVAFSGLFDGEFRAALLLGLPLLLVKAGAEQSMALRRAELRPGVYSLMQIMQGTVGFLVALLLIKFVLMNEHSLLLGSIVGFGVIWLIDTPSWLRRALGGKIRTDVVRRMASFGLPVSLTTIFTFVVASSDRYMLQYFMDTDAVGLYSVGYNLADRSIMSLFALVSLAGLPLAVKLLESRGEDAARKQLRANFILVVALGCPAVVGLAILARPIAEIFLGSDYRNAAIDIMPLIALSAFLAGFKTFYLDHAFHLGKRTDLLFFSVLPPAAVNILANFVLIPSHGLLGAVYATLIAYGVAAALSLYLGRRAFSLPLPAMPLLIALGASGVMAAALTSVTFPSNASGLFLAVMFGVTVFLAVSFILNLGGMRDKLIRRSD